CEHSARAPQCEPRFSHQIQPQFWSDIDFVQKTVTMKFAQTGFLALTEIKEKLLAIIFSTEFGRDFRLRQDEIVQFFQIVIAELPQLVGNFLRILDFWSNQPEGEDKRKRCDLRPGFRK